MNAPKGKHFEDEIQALRAALGSLGAGMERLREAHETVSELLEKASEAVAMPNSRRGEQQIRTALNAAAGAEQSLKRRLELRQDAIERGGRHSGIDERISIELHHGQDEQALDIDGHRTEDETDEGSAQSARVLDPADGGADGGHQPTRPRTANMSRGVN